MKVLFSIWILAVLIQEVIPSTLVRLPRHTDKDLSSVHTEYEAKYEQKGKHGNGSFSSVSGKQEIVHDNCAENWNSFAEKCASLIKDLVASLANAVSSKPGDATNLQLHIKNTFRHFDNTHNCTCLNHTVKTLSDINLSPLFKNITVNSKTDGSGVKYRKCGGKDAPCEEDKDSDTIKDEIIVLEPKGEEDDEKVFDEEHSKDKHHPSEELYYEYNNRAPTENVEENDEKEKQYRALVDAEHMKPENSENSGDESTSNSRRQIKYPEHLHHKHHKHHKISENSDHKHDDPKHSYSHEKHPESFRYPFLVTVRPNPHSAEPSESLPVVLNHPSLSETALEKDVPKFPEYEPSQISLPQESTFVPLPHSAGKSKDVPSSASHIITSPNHEKSSPKNIHLRTAPHEPHSSFIEEDDPKVEVLSSDDSGLKEKLIDPATHRKNHSPVIIYEKPYAADYNPDKAVLVPKKSIGPEKEVIYNGEPEAEKSLTGKHALNPVIIPEERHDHKLPSAVVIEEPVTDTDDNKSDGHSVVEDPLLVKSSSGELNAPSAVILPEESETDPHISESHFIAEERIESGHDENLPETIPAVDVEKEKEKEECKSTESELPEISSTEFIKHEKLSEGSAKEWLLYTTPIMYDLDKISKHTRHKVHQPQEDEKSHNGHSVEIPVSDKKLESEDDIKILHPHPIYKHTTVVPEYNSAILSPEDLLPIAENEKPLIEESVATEHDKKTEDDLHRTISIKKPISSVPEIDNQELEIAVPVEKQEIDSDIPKHSSLIEPELSEPKYSDKEIVKDPVKTLYYPHQPVHDEIYTTPLPFYPVKTAKVIPESSKRLHSEPEDSEKHESHEKDCAETETPEDSDKPEISIVKDEHRPNAVIVEDTENEEKPSKTEGDTPFIVYPVKPLPITTPSPDGSEEKSNKESDKPVLVNSGHSDDNEESESESPVIPLEVEPVIHEQENSDRHRSLQPVEIAESSVTHDLPKEHEHPVIYAPVEESDNVENPQVIVKPDKISTEPHDPPEDSVHLKYVPISISDSETIPVIYSEPEPETVIKETPLKPAEPGVLIHNTDDQPEKGEEHNTLIIEPTTYQTTSDYPTPSQVKVPGLLTHTTPQDSDETIIVRPSTSPKSTIHEHDDDDDDDEDCCSCESCTEEEISDPKLYKETACKNLEEARKELKAIFDKIKKKLKCGRKAHHTITSS